MTYFSKIGFLPGLQDNAGRLRVSSLNSLGDYKILNSDIQPLLIEYNGTGANTVSTNKVNMSVTAGQYRIAQSKVYHPYLNGKSQFINITTANFGASANLEKSFAYISSDATGTFSTGLDGFRMFKSTADVYSFQVWRNGVLISDQIQSTWSDKLDGTGPSGMTINFSNFNIFAFDFLYLGGSCINCYVYYNGEFRLFNTYYHANVDSSPMFNSPNKPVRWEIRSTTGAGNMDVICAEVATEGSLIELGQSVSINSSSAGFNAAATGVTYALCGIRKKTTARDIFAFVDVVEGMINTNDYTRIDLILNPTVAGVFTYADFPNSPFQTATGVAANTVTGGIILSTTFSSQNMNNARQTNNALTRLGCTLNNTMDALVLCITPCLASVNVVGTGTMNVKWYT